MCETRFGDEQKQERMVAKILLKNGGLLNIGCLHSNSLIYILKFVYNIELDEA